MESFTLLPFLFGLALFVFIAWTMIRILHKAGYSGWWILLLLIPLVNILMIWIFAFADWPNLRHRKLQNTAVTDQSTQ